MDTNQMKTIQTIGVISLGLAGGALIGLGIHQAWEGYVLYQSGAFHAADTLREIMFNLGAGGLDTTLSYVNQAPQLANATQELNKLYYHVLNDQQAAQSVEHTVRMAYDAVRSYSDIAGSCIESARISDICNSWRDNAPIPGGAFTLYHNYIGRASGTLSNAITQITHGYKSAEQAYILAAEQIIGGLGLLGGARLIHAKSNAEQQS